MDSFIGWASEQRDPYSIPNRSAVYRFDFYRFLIFSIYHFFKKMTILYHFSKKNDNNSIIFFKKMIETFLGSRIIGPVHRRLC